MSTLKSWIRDFWKRDKFLNRFLLIELACLLILIVVAFTFSAVIFPFLPTSWQETVISGIKSSESLERFTDPVMLLIPPLFRILFSAIIGLFILFLILAAARSLLTSFLNKKSDQ